MKSIVDTVVKIWHGRRRVKNALEIFLKALKAFVKNDVKNGVKNGVKKRCVKNGVKNGVKKRCVKNVVKND